MGWKKFPPHIYCTFVVFYWGFVATIQATITNWAGLMACRFFLGMAEAMFAPGVPYYLTFWYPRAKVAFRHGVFISGAAFANAYGGALAYALSHINGSIAPWKILFIIEGIPTCLLAGFAWFYLPDSIATAKFLNEREKQIAVAAVARDQEADPDRAGGFQLKEVFLAFKEPKGKPNCIDT
jgi:MFS family permease